MKELTPHAEHLLYQPNRKAWAAYQALKYAAKHSQMLKQAVAAAIPEPDRKSIKEHYDGG